HPTGLILLVTLVLLIPHLSTAATSRRTKPADSSSSSGGQSASSAQASQTPAIPLDLSIFAYCKRQLDSSTRGDRYWPWTESENLRLSQAYNQNRWKDLQNQLRDFLLCALKCEGPDHKPLKLPKDGYYSVVFLNQEVAPPSLVRVLIHDPFPEIY